MILFPTAKINLGLNVLYKREDGFHEIESVMIPIPLLDVLEILESSSFEFRQTGLPITGDISDNLCVRAYELLRSRYDLPPVYMHLRKEIPMGAGLGGGSADAAYVLKGINELFQLNLSVQQLEQFAAELGSDCPFFILNEAQLARGRGEVLEPINVDLTGYWLKIVNPGIHVGTKEAYAGIQFRDHHESIREIIHLPVSEWKDRLINDFERSVFAIHPSLHELKEELYRQGAVYAAMSGSGSTMFGLFSSKPDVTNTQEGFLEKVLQL